MPALGAHWCCRTRPMKFGGVPGRDGLVYNILPPALCASQMADDLVQLLMNQIRGPLCRTLLRSQLVVVIEKNQWRKSVGDLEFWLVFQLLWWLAPAVVRLWTNECEKSNKSCLVGLGDFVILIFRRGRMQTPQHSKKQRIFESALLVEVDVWLV